MSAPLINFDLWTRQGITVLWDGDQLNNLCEAKDVISLRRFLDLYKAGWPDDDLPLINDKALVVAGLESCIDALNPNDAVEWLSDVIYQAIISYQQEVADGGNQAALILWIAEQRRLQYQTSDDVWYWHCGTEYKDEKIPLSRCLFNGAYRDQRPLHITDGNKEFCVGIYHPRISA